MCGIIGYIGTSPAQNHILKGLKRMEYRGYDSAGIATYEGSGICVTKSAGDISCLHVKLRNSQHKGTVGIGHTRWATHGSPTDSNAHPHITNNICIAHNGIIENFLDIKANLTQKGYTFKTQTDSEVLCALIDHEYTIHKDPLTALKSSLLQVRGSYGLVVLFQDKPDLILAAKKSSPLLIAHSSTATIIASDPTALSTYSKEAYILEDNDIAVCSANSVTFFSLKSKSVLRRITPLHIESQNNDKNGFHHYMEKEIYDQPLVIKRILAGLSHENSQSKFAASSLMIVGCGTAYNAGVTAKYLLEPLLKIPITVEVASELRYRHYTLKKSDLAIAISQSGETADTIACIEDLKRKKIRTIGVVNVSGSTIDRIVDTSVLTQAGAEISVASTKAFSSQVTSLLLFCMTYLNSSSTNSMAVKRLLKDMNRLPSYIDDVLALSPHIKKIACTLVRSPYMMSLGRDTLSPIASEIALKIKELSYIPINSYPSGEMKHGPNALLSSEMSVIYLHGAGELEDKSFSNLSEVRARNAGLCIMTDSDISPRQHEQIIRLPRSDRNSQPIIFAIAGQLLAYHMAVALGRNVDKPRNLAKSVTVE